MFISVSIKILDITDLLYLFVLKKHTIYYRFVNFNVNVTEKCFHTGKKYEFK
jgi:hypothetical protein